MMKMMKIEKKGKGASKDGEENIALTLIEKGYAEIIRHAKTQIERSEDYNLLQKAYEKAQKNKVGVNISDKLKAEKMNDPLSQLQDYSDLSDESLRKNKRIQLLQWLRGRKVNAVIEFIFSANRLKLLIPERNAAIAVMLADIRCGGWSTGSGRNDNDPFRNEAKKYLEDTILQREVIVEITNTDMNRGRGGRGRGRGRGNRRG
eukprot:84970_1